MLRRILLISYFSVSGLISSAQDLSDCLPNIGFENGLLTNWETYLGGINLDGTYMPFRPEKDTVERHYLIRKGSLQPQSDEYGKFSLHSPNGSDYVIRLGSSNPRAKAERISYKMTVPANVDSYALSFNYAVVLQNPGHEPFKQPKFTVAVFDETLNTYGPCATFQFVTPGNLGTDVPGFGQSSVGDSVLFKPWSAVLINLTEMRGHVIRLEFTTSDCAEGGHFGYAYIDFDENCASSPISGNITCPEKNSITLTSFPGFAKYRWYNAQNPSITYGTSQNITLSPVPPVGTRIALELTPSEYSGGCVETMYTTIRNMEPIKVVSDPVTCLPFFDLTAKYIIAGNRQDLTYTYYYDAAAQNPIPDPKRLSAGTYYIMGTLPSGCFSIVPVHSSIEPMPPVAVAVPRAVAYPASTDLTTAYEPIAGITYTYWQDRDAKIKLLSPANIRVGGVYYIKGENDLGCSVITAVNVDIKLPDIVIPNTFTPNGDGVNDLLTILLDSRIKVKSFRIYTRWGQQVFATSDINQYWNGYGGNSKVPSGTYYWFLEGDENSRKYTRKGSITVLR